MNTEREYRYNGPESESRFKAKLSEVMGLFYSDRFPPPKQLGDKAWEIIGKGQTERFVRLALDWLSDGFKRDRIVATLKEARYYALESIAKSDEMTRQEARGGMAAAIADEPGMSSKDRAIFAYTRHCIANRKPLFIGDPGCEEQMREFNDGMRDDDPQWVAEWVEIARIDASHRPKSDATIRRERIEATHV